MALLLLALIAGALIDIHEIPTDRMQHSSVHELKKDLLPLI